MITPTLESIWNEFAVRLAQFIRARVSGRATVEDILQDVFGKIQGRLDSLEDPSRLQSWLYSLTRNAIIDHYRTRKETTEVPESLPTEPPSNDMEMEELKAAVRRMISSLPEPYRAALVLTEFEGLTQKEVAERFGLSLSGAKSRVQRGREQLKQLLHERCTFEFDRRGRVIDCAPRANGSCQECG